MRPCPLDETHVQALLAQLLEHGFGELHVIVRNHVIEYIVPMPLMRAADEVQGVHLILTSTKTRTSISR